MLGMVCVDVDGTLIGTDNTVRDDVWEALKRTRDKGIRLVLCSGRPAFGNALAYAQRMDPDGWHVFQNGSSVMRATLGESLSEPFPAQVLQQQLAHARQTGQLLEVYTDHDYAFTNDSAYAQEHARLLGVPYVLRQPEELTAAVVRTQWVVPDAEETALIAQRYPDADYHPSISPAMPGVRFISTTRKGTSKGSAVQRVAQSYGLSMEQVMMVGDAENDLTALQVVGHPVAMGNADDIARAAARYHVAHVDEGGLIEALHLAWKLD